MLACGYIITITNSAIVRDTIKSFKNEKKFRANIEHLWMQREDKSQFLEYLLITIVSSMDSTTDIIFWKTVYKT